MLDLCYKQNIYILLVIKPISTVGQLLNENLRIFMIIKTPVVMDCVYIYSVATGVEFLCPDVSWVLISNLTDST